MASEVYSKTEAISTGLGSLDRITGIGGIAKKRITEISGVWSVGKTTLALQLIKSAQEQKIKCVYMDAEWAWDELYARSLGVETKKLALLQTRYSESALDDLLKYCEEEKNTLIIIDAVGALHAREEAEKGAEERTIGAQSSLVARFCRKVVPLLAINNHALVVLNHEYTPIMSTGGRPQVKTSGGMKLEYHKSMWIRLQKTGINLKQGDKHLGFEVSAEIRKNKMAATQKQECVLEMYYGKGFVGNRNLFEEAIEKGIIKKTGNTFFYGEKKLGIGKVNASLALTEETLNEIQGRLN